MENCLFIIFLVKFGSLIHIVPEYYLFIYLFIFLFVVDFVIH